MEIIEIKLDSWHTPLDSIADVGFSGENEATQIRVYSGENCAMQLELYNYQKK